MPDEDDGRIRLQVYLARAGVASRRAAERVITEGRVSVNGLRVMELGTKVGPDDHVEIDGRPVAARERLRYLILNKPPGYICAMSDPEGRPLAVQLLKAAVAERVYNVGRLDQWSAGLLLFTNDGELASRLVHPSGGIDKEYELQADAPLPDEFFADFPRGVEIDGLVYKAESLRRTGPSSARVVLLEGRNREIRRVLESFGRRALSLRRVRIGPLQLGDLAEGSFRDLRPEELRALSQYRGSEGSRPQDPSSPRSSQSRQRH
ncbi:MAG TPA: pseudouridine synthase [Rectinemataceae bacterium]|nr:pseudouridine synthase [Rectinemataceae bacterium]